MRTTLTLDDDVAAALARRRSERGSGLREEVNALLRSALTAEAQPPLAADDYEPPVFDPGRALIVDYRELGSILDQEDVARGMPGVQWSWSTSICWRRRR